MFLSNPEELGVPWNSSLDVLTFEFDELIKYANSLMVNKYSILNLTVKIFDPLGLISTFVIQIKMLFQFLPIHQSEGLASDTDLRQCKNFQYRENSSISRSDQVP